LSYGSLRRSPNQSRAYFKGIQVVGHIGGEGEKIEALNCAKGVVGNTRNAGGNARVFRIIA